MLCMWCTIWGTIRCREAHAQSRGYGGGLIAPLRKGAECHAMDDTTGRRCSVLTRGGHFFEKKPPPFFFLEPLESTLAELTRESRRAGRFDFGCVGLPSVAPRSGSGST